MYSSHSKDINRNKSFHPLTYENLRKIERLKEKAKEKTETEKERSEQLRRDQESRRYDDLLLGTTSLATSSTSTINETKRNALYNQVKSIFAAEYENDEKSCYQPEIREQQSLTKSVNKQEEMEENRQKFTNSKNDWCVTNAKDEEYKCSKKICDKQGDKNNLQHTFLTKFRKLECEELGTENNNETSYEKKCNVHNNEVDQESIQSNKNDHINKNTSSEKESQQLESAPSITGFISTAEVVKLQKELDHIKKQRLDPLRKVENFNNNTIVIQTRRHTIQQSKKESINNSIDNDGNDKSPNMAKSNTRKEESLNKEIMQARIAELLAFKRKRK